MDISQDNKILEFFVRRTIWYLINERHQWDLEITKWRSSVNEHFDTIESNLRHELQVMHDITVDTINLNLKKHCDGEISIKDFENEIQLHMSKYYDGTRIECHRNDSDIVEHVERRNENLDLKCEEIKQTDKNDSYTNKVATNEIPSDISDAEENVLNQTKIEEMKYTGCDEKSSIPIDLDNSSENKKDMVMAVRTMESIAYQLKIDASPDDVAKLVPSLGSCTMDISQRDPATEVNIKDQYYTMLLPVLRCTSTVRPKDEKKVR